MKKIIILCSLVCFCLISTEIKAMPGHFSITLKPQYSYPILIKQNKNRVIIFKQKAARLLLTRYLKKAASGKLKRNKLGLISFVSSLLGLGTLVLILLSPISFITIGLLPLLCIVAILTGKIAISKEPGNKLALAGIIIAGITTLVFTSIAIIVVIAIGNNGK